MYLEQVKQQLQASRLVAPNDLKPCTPAEVVALEEQVGLPLPGAYKEFLLWMGQSAGRFMRHSDFFYPAIPELKEAARELLEENSFTPPLPEDALVIFMHEGYQFAFIRTTEGDDPPVYYFKEGYTLQEFRNTYPRYSDYLSDEIAYHKKLMDKLG